MKKKKLRKGTLLAVLTMMALVPCICLVPLRTAEAGSQTFVLPNEIKAIPANLINGSFESPHYSSGNVWHYFNESAIPGWETTPADYQNEVDKASGYQTIEYFSAAIGTYVGSPATMANGVQCTELNAANLPMRIYQDISTAGGSRLFWQFAHRARVSDHNASTTYDVANLYIRSSGTPTATPTSDQLIQTARDNGTKWGYYKGIYTVPEGQTSTEIAFQAISWGDGWIGRGNLLDYVRLQTGASLIAKKSISTSASDDFTALSGETVTMTVAITNWGETDASRCVFRDVLSDYLDYVDGSAQINGVDAGSLATFNSTTDELRVNFGSGATAGTTSTNGGLLKGSISTGTSSTTGEGGTITITFQATVTGDIGDIVENQASVTYNDSGWESYNSGDFTCYSSVLGETTTAGDETTYVNRFTIVDRSVHGTVWYDADADGMIDSSETLASGLTVGLYGNTDTTYTTPANDANGDALVTTTDANGDYSFIALPEGTYQAVLTLPDGCKVTLKTTSTDNDAVESGNYGTVSDLSLTQTLSATNVSDSITDVDMGLAPRNSINGTLWYDTDTDGAIDTSEAGVSGWTVGLYDSTDTAYTTPANDIYGNPLTATTDANGVYSFTGIPSGTYKAVVATPGGYVVTTKTASTDNDAVADGVYAIVSGITFDSTTSGVDQIDFGFTNLKISGTVWYDASFEGTIDTTEARYSGATVTLYYNGDTAYTTPEDDIYGDPLTTTTDANGEYTFTGVPAGMYQAVVTTPTGYTVTVLANDNDASAAGVYAIVGNIDLTSGVSAENEDFGFVEKHSITLSKLVTGELADTDKDFRFTIKLNGASGSFSYTGISTATGVDAPADGALVSGNTITLKHGQGIVIEGVPSGTQLTVIENDYLGYDVSNVVTLDGGAGTVTGSNTATGTLTDDTEVVFYNERDYVTPTGVIVDNLPYIVMAILASGVLLLGLQLKRGKRAASQTQQKPARKAEGYRGL